MKPPLLIPFLLLTAALCLPRPAAADVTVGDTPKLAFDDAITGRRVDLADLRGKIVVVDFWATWCKPCMHEAEHIVRLNQQYAPRGLQLIGVSLDTDAAAMARVAKEKNFAWPQDLDKAGLTPRAAATAWGVNSIPATFILGPDGTVLWHGHPAEIDEPLAKAFRDHPPQLIDPRSLASIKSALTAAEAAADKDPAKAAKLRAAVPPAVALDPDANDRFKALTDKLSARGQSDLDAAAAMLDAKQFAAAAGKLRDAAALVGLPVAATAKAKLAALDRDPAVRAAMAADRKSAAADAALAAADKLKSAGKDEQAYPKFQSVVSTYPNTPAAATAADAVKAYEADPAFVAKVKAKADARKAQAALAQADTLRSAGRTADAKAKYADVVKLYPGTTYAKTAQAALDGMGG